MRTRLLAAWSFAGVIIMLLAATWLAYRGRWTAVAISCLAMVGNAGNLRDQLRRMK